MNIGSLVNRLSTHDGWAVKSQGYILDWTFCSTREEVRSIKRELDHRLGEQLSLFDTEPERAVVKVRMRLEEVE